jgi:hypothetical protein
MIDAVWKLIIFVIMLYRITKFSWNERVTPLVYNVYPNSVRCVHPWSHGTHPSVSLILAALWSACLVWWSPQKVHQVKTIGHHFQSLSQHPPHSYSRHLQFTTRMAHRPLQTTKKILSHQFHFLLTHADVCTFPFTKASLCLELLIPTPNAVGRRGITLKLSPKGPLNRNNWFMICKL